MLSILNRSPVFCQKKPPSKGLPPTANSIQHDIELAKYQTRKTFACNRCKGYPLLLLMDGRCVITWSYLYWWQKKLHQLESWNWQCANAKSRLVDPITIAFAEKKTTSHALKDAGAWVMRAPKIHILYKCSVMIVVTRKRDTLRHYSWCKYK